MTNIDNEQLNTLQNQVALSITHNFLEKYGVNLSYVFSTHEVAKSSDNEYNQHQVNLRFQSPIPYDFNLATTVSQSFQTFYYIDSHSITPETPNGLKRYNTVFSYDINLSRPWTALTTLSADLQVQRGHSNLNPSGAISTEDILLGRSHSLGDYIKRIIVFSISHSF